jgi:hypothetical protein
MTVPQRQRLRTDRCSVQMSFGSGTSNTWRASKPSSAAPERSSSHDEHCPGSWVTISSGFSRTGRFLPGAPTCLPRRRTSAWRSRFCSSRRSARIFVASTRVPGESEDGGIEEFCELLESRASSSAILRARRSFSSRSAVFSATSALSERPLSSSGTPASKATLVSFRESAGQGRTLTRGNGLQQRLEDLNGYDERQVDVLLVASPPDRPLHVN